MQKQSSFLAMLRHEYEANQIREKNVYQAKIYLIVDLRTETKKNKTKILFDRNQERKTKLQTKMKLIELDRQRHYDHKKQQH